MHQLITASRNSTPLISIIIPVFNEEEALRNFLTVVTSILEGQNFTYELLFVNDGSSDGTLDLLLQFSNSNTHIRIINFSRNFGKEAALTAGMDMATGDAVIPMDVDMQDPPELIGRFVEQWHNGYDVIYGIRSNRQADGLTKKTTASWFYWLFNSVAYIGIPENAGDFRLIDRRVVEVLRRLPERNRFMKGLFAWVGFRSLGIPYARPARALGITKWNYWQLWNFALDGLVSFSSVPLRFWSYFGGIVACCAFVYAIIIIIRVLVLGIDLPGYASLMSVILFMGGVQLLSIGIIGEYLGRIFIEVKGRPIYVVEGIYHNGNRV